jgi:DNA-binding SARP family transcriptional activator
MPATEEAGAMTEGTTPGLPSDLTFRILGPLAIEYGGRSVSPTAPKPRAVLALLCFRANHVVPTSLLVDELWGARPPSTALNTLQTYIFQLRKLLATTLKTRTTLVSRHLLTTHSAGYTLHARPDQLDSAQFEELLDQGRTASAAGEHSAAAACFQRALDLWRGPIALECHSGRVSQAHVACLEEQRMYALEQRIEACLALHYHRELLGDLASLVVEHHLHESLHAKYMIALHRAGRPSDALAVFRALRQRMMDELGIEPSAHLQALHRALLSADSSPALATPPARELAYDR